MNVYLTKVAPLTGTSYSELIKKARRIFHDIEKQTKRRPYIRSSYFNKEKVFFDLFWIHLSQKNPGERKRRLYYFPCAIDVIENIKTKSIVEPNPFKKNEMFYRFTAMTVDHNKFFVQIKEDMKTGQKFFMSVYPEN